MRVSPELYSPVILSWPSSSSSSADKWTRVRLNWLYMRALRNKMSKWCSSLGRFKCLLPLLWSWRVLPLYLGVPSLIPARYSTKCTGLSSSRLKTVTSESFPESPAFYDSHEPIRAVLFDCTDVKQTIQHLKKRNLIGEQTIFANTKLT